MADAVGRAVWWKVFTIKSSSILISGLFAALAYLLLRTVGLARREAGWAAAFPMFFESGRGFIVAFGNLLTFSDVMGWF